MSWRVAESLEVLRRQLNEAFPKRSKLSDGGIGDAKHAATKSDHNPWVQFKGMGIVTARDYTHDPANGLDCNWLAGVLVKNKDSRIKYIIWNRRICSSKVSPWKWRAYDGKNAHTKHLHLSVDADPKRFDSVTPWDLDLEDDVARVDDGPDFSDVTDDEIDGILDIPQVPTNSAADGTATQPASDELTAKTSVRLEPATSPQPPNVTDEQPPPATEIHADNVQVNQSGDTGQNQQDVNEPAKVHAPEPYNGVGFIATIKKDFALATGGNLSFQGLSEYMQHASGWPVWATDLVSKAAVGALILTLLWFIFRIVHFIWDGWKKNQKTRVEAEAATSTVRKDIEWI